MHIPNILLGRHCSKPEHTVGILHSCTLDVMRVYYPEKNDAAFARITPFEALRNSFILTSRDDLCCRRQADGIESILRLIERKHMASDRGIRRILGIVEVVDTFQQKAGANGK
jgi:hypothetical protein